MCNYPTIHFMKKNYELVNTNMLKEYALPIVIRKYINSISIFGEKKII